MRARRWVLFLFFFLLVAGAIYFRFWQLIQENDRVRNYIVSRIRPILGQSFDIGNIYFGVGNVHVTGVSVPLPDQQLSLSIDDVRIGYNPVTLLVYGFSPQILSKDILLERPKLFITLDSTKTTTNFQLENVDQVYDQGIEQLRLLGRLTIKNGEIIYLVQDGNRLRLGNSIEGAIYTTESDSIDIRLVGKLFSSDENNLKIDGRADFEKKTLSFAHIAVDNFQLKDPIPNLLPENFVFTDGTMNGHLYLTRRDSINRFRLDGQLVISNGAAEVNDDLFYISEMNLNTDVRDWNIILNRSTQKINNAQFDCFGTINKLLTPNFNLQGRIENLPIEFVEKFSQNINGKVHGQVDANLAISGSIDSLLVSLDAKSPEINYSVWHADNLHLKSEISHGKVHLSKCNFTMHENLWDFVGDVFYDSTSHYLNVTANAQGTLSHLFPKLGEKKIVNSAFTGTLSGSLDSLAADGNVKLDFVSPEDTLSLVQPFVIKENICQFVVPNSETQIAGTVDFQTLPASINIQLMKFEQIAALMYDFPAKDYLIENFVTEISINGNPEQYRANLLIREYDRDIFINNLLDVNARVRHLPQETLVAGSINIRPNSVNETIGSFMLRSREKSLEIEEFDFENLHGQFLYKKEDSLYVDGYLEARNFSVTNVLGINDSLATALLDADIDFGAFQNSIKMVGDVGLKDAFLNGVGPYNSSAHFDFDKYSFDLAELLVNSEISTLFHLKGQYRYPNENLEFSCKGAGFDLNSFFPVERQSENILSGTALVDIELTGSVKSPKIDGIFASKDGYLGKIPYDEIQVTFNSDSLNKDENGIYADNIKILRTDNYQLNGHAFFPISSSDSLDIELNGNGNFLRILTDFARFFKETKSDGQFYAHVSGTPENPVLDAANLVVENGEIEFSSIIPRTTTVSAEIEFEPENQFFHLRKFSGKIRKKDFSIYNQLYEPNMSSRPFSNIQFGDSGLNLGVFVFESPDKGVPLNIKGIMEPGVFGDIDFQGREYNEKFYLGMLNGVPYLRGRWDLYDTEFMYPFYEGVGAPADIILSFLVNSIWDVLVVPMNDVRYVRTFPGAIDEVYVNLQLDSKFSNLEFLGQVHDESFRINGEVRSTTGLIEYLDMNFRVENAGAQFDKSSLEPVVYGSARTSIADSTGRPTNIYLTLQTVDETMDQKDVDNIVRDENTRGRWNSIRFKLSSDNPTLGDSEAQIMASLGYSAENLGSRALDAIGYGTENLLLRPIIRPIERRLERSLGLDYVRFSSRITQNIIDFNLNRNLYLNNRLALLKSTKVVVGKYLAEDLFLQYTGQIEAGVEYLYSDKSMGLHHTVGFEYRINPQLLLELEYDYDSMMLYSKDRDDKRIVLRHWFPF